MSIIHFPDGLRLRSGIAGGVDVTEGNGPVDGPILLKCRIRHPITRLVVTCTLPRKSAYLAGDARKLAALWDSVRKDAVDCLRVKLTTIAKRN